MVFYNIFKRFRIAANLMLSSVSLASTLLFTIILINLMNTWIIPPVIMHRMVSALLLLISALILGFHFLYPYPRPKRLVFAMASVLTGLLLCVGIVATDTFISEAPGGEAASLARGPGYPIYLAAVSAFLLLSLIVIGFKALRFENRALRNDLIYLCIGTGLLSVSFLALSLYLPSFRGISRFSTIGILVPIPLILITLNYAATNVRAIDLKKFFFTVIYWFILFAILIVPSMLLLKFNSEQYIKEPIPPLWIALVLFAYLFLVFKYLHPRIQSLFLREYRNLVALVDELFRSQHTASKQENVWEEFLQVILKGLTEIFEISSAYFYLYYHREKKFTVTYSIGADISDTKINLSGPLVEFIGRNPGVLYRHAVYSETEPGEHRNAVLEYFERNRLEIILPFLNPENQIIGLLALGQLARNRIYSKSLLSALELYRIQFQQNLANALMLEKVRATQVLDHDLMVVNAVKKKIMPQSMSQMNGFRMSSFNINNSPYGGDYIDSVKINENAIALFMSDSSYSGIDSAIISLEVYAVLHTPAKILDSPDKILGTMNWVIATSRFSKKYASAYCAILSSSGELSYANASFNPMVIFNPRSDAFTACNASGVPVGVDRASKYELKSARLVPGSTGIIYSDGLVSAINPDGEPYAFDRVKELLRDGKNKTPADLTRNIFDDFNRFIKNKKQTNDVSVIIFKFK
ncbi:MAG: hypothetical protein A2176_08950 [Spirochaetes bacterium RBG_13_51_14]|nr:MAG: hypothetical protein A2176_08950 [Spirochaetes bacterium RBG_13_51_14]